MPRQPIVALASLSLLLLLSVAVKADPLVITGGTANILGPATGPAVASFNLLAPGFSATGMGDRNSAAGLTIINGRSTFRGSFTNGAASGGGVVFLDTRLDFTLAPFTPPDPASGADTAFVSRAFTMIGVLDIRAFDVGLPVLFNSEVSGSGFALITYQRISPDLFIPTNITYFFGATEPIPEPATVVLFSIGLAGIAAKVRRRRKAAGEA
ncbi:MAG TPA: PEP-CTERM sorting domain-containing protein [Pyrinomonadaceae bacterium]|nr:PEP-CTERM sorting domain-containing protein [Pyrinomonadaceae bacterium]